MSVITDNIFYKNRMDIKAISEANHVTIDVASRTYVRQKGLSDYQNDLIEWDTYCASIMRDKHKTLADIF